jgi:hypothetical protein
VLAVVVAVMTLIVVCAAPVAMPDHIGQAAEVVLDA